MYYNYISFFMDILTEKITRMMKYSNPFDIYISLITYQNQEELDVIFYHFYNVLFTENEKAMITKRLKQSLFRDKLIERYKKCIMTNSPPIMCEACHIIPFCESSDEQKYDIDNGLLLEAGIHKLFDEYLISIKPNNMILDEQINNCEIVLSKNILADKSFESIHYLNKKHLHLPVQTLIYINCHYNIFSQREKLK